MRPGITHSFAAIEHLHLLAESLEGLFLITCLSNIWAGLQQTIYC